MNLHYTLTIIVGVQLLAFHILALEFYLYWVVWWYDLMMHVLGGIWLVFVYQSFVQLEWVSQRYYTFKQVLSVGAFSFLLWEGFGIYVSAGFKTNWLLDTTGDTLCGIVGLLLGYWIIDRLKQLA